jgi:DNA-binding transcriptional MerR regulator
MKDINNDTMLVSIKDFSDFTGIKQSVLRYYDDIGLFCPAQRGENNYRYYSLTQIQTIKLIDMLRELNIPLKKIEELMENRSPESMVELLIRHEVELTSELRALQESFSLIHNLRTLIQNDVPQDENTFYVKFAEERRISLGPVTDFRPNETHHRAYSNYYRIARNMRVNLGYHIGGYYDTFDEYQAEPGRPKRFFSLDPNGLDVKPAGTYLYGYTRGDYGVSNDLPERMKKYIEDNNIKVLGPVYNVYPLNEVCLKDPDEYLSAVAVRIARDGNES